MSCDWNIYCRTCDDQHGFNDANHQEELMHALIRHAPEIAALSDLVSDKDAVFADVELRASHYGTIDPVWFKRHLGHDLIPRDEYGRCADKCAKYVKCGGCGSSKRCSLALGHEGDHAP